MAHPNDPPTLPPTSEPYTSPPLTSEQLFKTYNDDLTDRETLILFLRYRNREIFLRKNAFLLSQGQPELSFKHENMMFYRWTRACKQFAHLHGVDPDVFTKAYHEQRSKNGVGSGKSFACCSVVAAAQKGVVEGLVAELQELAVERGDKVAAGEGAPRGTRRRRGRVADGAVVIDEAVSEIEARSRRLEGEQLNDVAELRLLLERIEASRREHQSLGIGTSQAVKDIRNQARKALRTPQVGDVAPDTKSALRRALKGTVLKLSRQGLSAGLTAEDIGEIFDEESDRLFEEEYDAGGADEEEKDSEAGDDYIVSPC